MRENISVAGVARRGNKVLVMHRLPGGSVGGLWEFPGGKCDPGETPEESLIREWMEETDLEIIVGARIARGSFRHNNQSFSLIAFEIELPSANSEPNLHEHDDWRWVSVDELDRLPLVESDHAVLEALRIRSLV